MIKVQSWLHSPLTLGWGEEETLGFKDPPPPHTHPGMFMWLSDATGEGAGVAL